MVTPDSFWEFISYIIQKQVTNLLNPDNTNAAIGFINAEGFYNINTTEVL